MDETAITAPAGTGETAAGPASISSASSIKDGAVCIGSVSSAGRIVLCVTRSGRLVVKSRGPWWSDYITRTPLCFGIAWDLSEPSFRCLETLLLASFTKRNPILEARIALPGELVAQIAIRLFPFIRMTMQPSDDEQHFFIWSYLIMKMQKKRIVNSLRRPRFYPDCNTRRVKGH